MVTGELGGGLLLGRGGFTGTGHAVWLGLASIGVPLTWASTALTLWVATLGLVCTAGVFMLARALGAAKPSWAALFFGMSPVIASLSGAVMSEIPALALVFWGLTLTVRGAERRAAATTATGAALIALSAAFRETAAAWVAVAPFLAAAAAPAGAKRRAGLTSGAGVAAGLCLTALVLAATNPELFGHLERWREGMSRSASLYPVPLSQQLGHWLRYSLAIGGAALPFAVWGALNAPRSLPLWIIVGASAVFWAAHALYQDLAYGPRFLAVALPGLVLLAGFALDAVGRPLVRTAAVALLVGVLAAGAIVSQPLREAAAHGHALAARLASLEAGTLLSGWHCPALHYHQSIGALSPSWAGLCPGWHWPQGELASTLRRAASSGPVYVDLSAAAWPSARFVDCRAEVEALWSAGFDRSPAGPPDLFVVTPR
jgi:hypothetical protein